MESIVDVTTTTFQAILAVCVVFTAGYAYTGKHAPYLSSTLVPFARTILLPSLIFTTFAGTQVLSAKGLLQLWPIIIIALLTHISSLALSLVAVRYAKAPGWVAESLTNNNNGSYPLLLLYSLYPIGWGRVLDHLRWRSMDTLATVIERATVYILINLVITEAARILFAPFIATKHSHLEIDVLDEPISDDQTPNEIVEDEEDADERTPLVGFKRNIRSTHSLLAKTRSPIFIATVLGLLVGLIKPLQRFIVGTDDGDTWLWGSIGLGLRFLGGAFALVEIIGIGAGIRAGEKHIDSEYKTPPTLGTVLTLVAWRLIAIPVIVLFVVYGFRKIPSTKVFLQDPAFASRLFSYINGSFVLALTSIAPPVLPTKLDPYQSSVLFSTFYTALITALPIAVAVAISGRGVSTHIDFDLVKALKSAGGGGLAGAAAMVVQVLTLMPMRTIMNYQYRYGGSLRHATKTLWDDGGFKRYYAGLAAALFQGPLSRFGDTAANAGILALLESFTWPVLVKTIAASVASACFRMTLTPIDTLKTTQQTQGGGAGLQLLKQRIRDKGIASLWYGALATAAATFVGHYPWFGTYNWLSAVLPPPHNIIQKLARQAFIGFSASVVSDTASNSLRVVKTYRQVHEGDVGYLTAAKEIVASEGLLGLFGRGLPTRLLTNGLQGLLFSILWKLFADM
nr:mitochondrial carrier protein [Kwoniella mangroviensis CBS 8507]OCF69600.1 mitochondrial carrier protein [Kwoniella mangroviensis CBS 8507]